MQTEASSEWLRGENLFPMRLFNTRSGGARSEKLHNINDGYPECRGLAAAHAESFVIRRLGICATALLKFVAGNGKIVLRCLDPRTSFTFPTVMKIIKLYDIAHPLDDPTTIYTPVNLVTRVMTDHHDDLPIFWRDHGDKTDYEAARARVFSTKLPDRYPTAVVRPRTDKHVVDSIRLAEKLGVRVAIRSGGHSWAFWSIRQDAVLIDLVDYKHVEYDEATRIVKTTTSVTSSEMTAFMTERGRFIPTGHCAGVGLGGFMLQGGMGHNSRVSGLDVYWNISV